MYGLVSVRSKKISPAQHQIHHSIDPQHVDKNYGATLSVWDGLLYSRVFSHNQSVSGFGIAGKTIEQVISKQLMGIDP
ncbi:MAG: sterol desaturase/sphingolipid hydroxylase (fatty acid hydroxylase superfamily) [Halioglobus sp.]|jgi:sterol desaturase/sphingolipid hydroxylase (fatty acid hydroxylase superfamily)